MNTFQLPGRIKRNKTLMSLKTIDVAKSFMNRSQCPEGGGKLHSQADEIRKFLNYLKFSCGDVALL